MIPMMCTNLSLLHNGLAMREPSSFEEARNDPKWVEAMEEEHLALEKSDTWSLCILQEGKKPLDTKWVYRVKHNQDGTIQRYKARLVARSENK